MADPLPPFSLPAAVSGRMLTPESLKGRKAVLVLHGATGTDFAKAISKAVRARHPSARDVTVASIVDLRPMAGLWRKAAEAQVRKTYERLAEKVREGLPGETPEDHVLICPDWDGAALQALGHPDAAEQPVALVVDAQGRLVASASGAGAADTVLQALG